MIQSHDGLRHTSRLTCDAKLEGMVEHLVSVWKLEPTWRVQVPENSHRHDEESPNLRIAESLPELAPFPRVIGGHVLVRSQSLDRDFLLSRSQPPRIVLVVGHEEDHGNAESERKGSEEQEKELPAGHSGGHCSSAFCSGRRAIRRRTLAYTVRDKTADEIADLGLRPEFQWA